MNLVEYNKNILKKYTGSRRKELKVAMLDDKDNVIKVFKNRYQAAKHIYDNGLSNYYHERGPGYTIACLAGALTNAIANSEYVYTKRWKLISPYDNVTQVTEPVVVGNAGKAVYKGINKIQRWLLVGRGKADKFSTISEIATIYHENESKISRHKQVKGFSIIPYNRIPRDKTFDSLTQACNFLRVDRETVKAAILNNTPIHNYFVRIPPEKMEANYKAVERLNKS
jgi:hypothetical protein